MRTRLPLLILLVGIITPFDCKPSTCEKRFELWTKAHSLCLPQSSKLIKSGIPTGRDRKTIIDSHNKARSIVQPSASDMQKMYWDDELALMVKGYLSSCPGRVHDKGNQRYSPGKYSVGQNLASGTFRYGWWGVVKMWYDEVKYHVYGDKAKMVANFQKIGHYTQVVWAKTSRVGCAWVKCKGQRKVYGCNYAVAGNLNQGYDKPYRKGPSCSECPGKCTNKLCDCGGKACYNQGTLDLKTCTCKCKGFYNDDAYVAKESCAIDCNRSTDYMKIVTNSRLCQRVVKDMNKCKRFKFYALACPWLCGLCPHAGFATGKSPKKPASRPRQQSKSQSSRTKQNGGTATRKSGTGTATGSRTSGRHTKHSSPVSSKGGQPKAWRCPKMFTMWSKKHSMCLPRSNKLRGFGIPTGKDRKVIVDVHNKARSIVQPKAANMQKMYWDDELAKIALGWLASCPGMRHDKHSQRYIPGKYPVGQNLAAGGFRYGWWGVIKAWYNEVKDFRYGNKAFMKSRKKPTGHYTQVVWHNSARVGCAWVKCKGKPKVYGCNYGPTGNWYRKLDKPYKNGTACDDCPGKCKNNLCDCGGKVCYNRGKLDLKTCTCKCYSKTYNKQAYNPNNSCALDCDKSVDYQKDSTKKWTCRRLAKNSKDKIKKKCRGGFYSLACPWMCDICPYVNGGNATVVKTKKASKTPETPKRKPKSRQKTSGGSNAQTARSGASSGTMSKQKSSPSKGEQPKPWKCPKVFAVWNKHHAMCLARSNKLNDFGIPAGKERKQIVDVHNRARSIVKPQAANMQKMYWDDELTKIALGWLASCPGMRHDKHSQRYIPGKYPVGQNLAAGGFRYGWWGVIKAWYNEVKDFRYANKAFMKSHKKPTGHYTQVVWHNSARVGCAWVKCKGQPKVYGCNYGPTGNWRKKLDRPYRNGTACEDCPGKCKNNLCDCGGKTCFNRGKLDVKTCTCKCYGFYNSRTYQPKNNCAADCNKSKDYKKNASKSRMCTQYAGTAALRKKGCRKGTFIALACPWLCGLCPLIDHRNH